MAILSNLILQSPTLHRPRCRGRLTFPPWPIVSVDRHQASSLFGLRGTQKCANHPPGVHCRGANGPPIRNPQTAIPTARGGPGSRRAWPGADLDLCRARPDRGPDLIRWPRSGPPRGAAIRTPPRYSRPIRPSPICAPWASRHRAGCSINCAPRAPCRSSAPAGASESCIAPKTWPRPI